MHFAACAHRVPWAGPGRPTLRPQLMRQSPREPQGLSPPSEPVLPAQLCGGPGFRVPGLGEPAAVPAWGRARPAPTPGPEACVGVGGRPGPRGGVSRGRWSRVSVLTSWGRKQGPWAPASVNHHPACRLLAAGRDQAGSTWPGWGQGQRPPLSTFSPSCRSGGPGPQAPVRWESRWGEGASRTRAVGAA